MRLDKFEKLSSPSENFADESEGMNLRMAIAKKLAMLHGGNIAILGQTSSGTVLAFVLPKHRVLQISLPDQRENRLQKVIEVAC